MLQCIPQEGALGSRTGDAHQDNGKLKILRDGSADVSGHVAIQHALDRFPGTLSNGSGNSKSQQKRGNKNYHDHLG